MERIAAGGMGEVYRATIQTMGGIEKTVALKLVRDDLLGSRKDFAAMFVEEAKVAMHLSHANVVQAFDVGRIDDRWFLAMEYVEGTTLGALLRASRRNLGQPIPHRYVVCIAIEVLKGLDYAHRRRGADGKPLDIVHRDVSPANILISWEGEVNIADFGIAKSAMKSVGTIAGTVKGKVPYMAPEQLRGAAVDRRADLYSMGAVLYQMLTGRRAFEADPAAIQTVLDGRFPRPREVIAEIPEALERIVLRAMATSPDDRYPSAAAMRQDLEQIALKEQYLLSSADLAEFVELAVRTSAREEEEDATEHDPSPPGSSPQMHIGPAAEPTSNPFDALLGRELEKIESAEPFSVFSTRLAIPLEAVERAAAAAEADTKMLAEPEPAARPATSGSTTSQYALPTRTRGTLTFVLAGMAIAAIAATAIVISASSGSGAPAEAPRVTIENRETPELALPPREPEPARELPIGVEPPPDLADPPTPAPQKGGRRARGQEPAPAATMPLPTPPPTAPSAQPALLSINTDPWAYVSIDGIQIRATPLLRHSLAAGRHRVVLRNPAESLEQSLSIELAPGEHRRISLDLRANP
jgi:serine/threonine-protein kinase